MQRGERCLDALAADVTVASGWKEYSSFTSSVVSDMTTVFKCFFKISKTDDHSDWI